jgi:hypothetical protein
VPRLRISGAALPIPLYALIAYTRRSVFCTLPIRVISCLLQIRITQGNGLVHVVKFELRAGCNDSCDEVAKMTRKQMVQK